jgi:hypothetical protein
MRDIKIADRDYPFKLSYNQQKAWQERFNKKFEDMGDELPFEECIALVFHGLKGGALMHRTELDIEEDELGDMLDQAEIIKFVQYLILDISKTIEEVSDNVKKKKVK